MALQISSREHLESFPVREFTLPVSPWTSFRTYSDTRPYNLKIRDLQKGLIWVHKTREVVGEGTGFGVPILKYNDETYFSGSANLLYLRKGENVTVQKEFMMDMVARDTFHSVSLENRRIRRLVDYMSLFYQKHDVLGRLILAIKGMLPMLGVRPTFVAVPSRGSVIAGFRIRNGCIEVQLDFRKIRQQNLERIFVMNEQSASFFRAYCDSEGREFDDAEVAAWKEVTAPLACIYTRDRAVGFGLRSIEGTSLRRGRESLKDSLDWIGLDYELGAHVQTFSYEIAILEPEFS